MVGTDLALSLWKRSLRRGIATACNMLEECRVVVAGNAAQVLGGVVYSLPATVWRVVDKRSSPASQTTVSRAWNTGSLPPV